MALAFAALCLGPARADRLESDSVGLAVSPTQSAMPRLGVKAPQNAALAGDVLRLLNLARTERGLTPLKLHGTLTRIAVERSTEMERLGYARDSATAQIQNSAIAADLAGENLFTARDLESTRLAHAVLEVWLNSERHRSNLLDPRATHVGLAVLQFSDRFLVNAFFVGQLDR